jgi:S-DNA-T family DNA segregation ATPase FtsK/SpoIIIE
MGARPFTPRPLAAVPPASRSTEAPRGLEAGAFILFAAAAFLSLALASARFDPDDPTVRGADWMGSVGGSIAGTLIQGFGCASWFAPLQLVLLGAPLLRGQRPQPLGLRLAGDLLLVIILAALLQVAVPDVQVFGAGLPGGNVGLFIGELMRALFSTLGSFLVGVTGIGLILIGRSSFSFIAWCERLARLARSLWLRLQAATRRLESAWREAWHLRRERAQAAQRTELPRIESHDRDEAIIMQLEEDTEWIPLEMTGVPPLSIAASLRAGSEVTALSSLEDFEDQDATPAPSAGDGLLGAMLDDTESPAGRAPILRSGAPRPEALRAAPARPAPAPAPPEDEPPMDDTDEEPFLVFGAASPAPASVAPPSAVPQRLEPAARAPEPPEPRIVDTKAQQQVTRAAAPTQPAPRAEGFVLPSTELLEPPEPNTRDVDRSAVLAHAERLEKTLADYGVTGKVEEIHPGPTVTTYEVAPAAGTKVSKVANLSDDLALGLSRKVRIIAPIPGKSRIGFELPNDEREAVNLRELVEDERFQKLCKKAPLPVVLGRDIVGAPFYADLASMPHVIVAGATGAGKSGGLNVMLSSLLFSRTPDELRLLMVDPKVVELAPFDGIPHLLLPVVTDMKQAATALRWAVDEMERRYQLFADAGTKNITTYNRWVERVRQGELPAPAVKTVHALDADGEPVEIPVAKKGGDGEQLPDRLPYIVIVVDEFADLMMQQGKEVETSVARLAQKARAAGMHVVLATQRPSVDVITGMIKANFPSRIAFRVAQKVDSRTILDEQGAEVLLGRGDMLVKLNGSSETLRVQCPFVSEEEVSALTDHLRAQGEPQYHEAILLEPDAEDDEDLPEEKSDARFEEAVRIVQETQRCSTSWLQRKMTIGYNRAAKIVEMMERRGYVGPANGAKDREVFLPPP